MKGRIDVIKKDLEAFFSWRPDVDGTEWDVESLRALLSFSDIRVEVPDSVLESALETLTASEEACESEVIARGIEPVVPKPLQAEISPVKLPDDVEAVLDEILKEAPSAEGEIEYGWVEKGSIAGTMIPAVKARAGLGLGREPLSAPELEGEDFRIGENLEIRGVNLVALFEGILRVEKNWADLVPCSRHHWSLSGSPEEGGCFLDYSPGHPALALPQAEELITTAGRQGFMPEKIISEEELRAVLATAVSDQKNLIHYPVSKDTDGYIGIETDPMNIRAELILRKETGNGIPLELNRIAAKIRDSGLRGLDGPGVKAAIMSFWKSEELSTVIVLKEGRAPERGPDKELEYLVPFLEEEEAEPIRERLEFEPYRVKGIASLKEFPASAVSRTALVQKEQPIARLGTAKTGKSGKDLQGKELPGFPGNDPELHVHEGLGWIENVIVAHESGLLDVGKTPDGITHLRIRPHKDAEIQITVTEDKFKALVSTRLPLGTGAPVSRERILGEAEKAGVVKGISEDAVKDVVERSLTGEIITGMVIAEGHLPMEGNTRLSLEVSGDPGKAPIPVKTGDVIGSILSGEDSGWNVLGEPLMDEKGVMTAGENILREEQEDKSIRLIAEKGGHLVMSEGRLHIKHLLDFVGDVSMASGNVHYPGKIKIDGSVLSRVVVNGGEGVEVTQVVQAALINSGGDVVIGKGIKGEGKAVIRSQGRLTLGYAEEANLLSSGKIIVGRTLMNCRVKCNSLMEISEKDGKLIGGVMKLKDGLICRDVGNERGVETYVSFGQDYLVENQIEQVQKEMAKIQEYINKIDSMMEEQEARGSSGNLIRIRQKKIEAMRIMEKKNLKLFLLREKFERHFDSEVRISGTAWPGVVFESHGRLIKVEEPLESVSITFNREKGRLEKKPLR